MKPFLDSLSLLQRSGAATSRWEAAKFAARGCWQWPAHRAWSRFLLGDEMLDWALAHPHLLWKLQRPYLQRRLPLADKLAWLQDHYRWTMRHCPEPLQRALRLGGQATLATFEAEDVPYRLVLAVDPQFAKEGEWTLALWRANVRLAVLAFSVHCAAPVGRPVQDTDADGAWVGHIGCLQGAACTEGNELIRTATKELQGLRPKQAVLQALYTLLRAPAGDGAVRALRAVANAGHIYQGHHRRRERVVADYDAFWCEFGALARGDWFQLPAVLPRKQAADIPARKRAQYRRRWELEDQLAAQVTAVFAQATAAPAPLLAAA